MQLSIIIPLFNEEKLVLLLLEKFKQVQFPSFLESWEIILVDDCSTDSSVEHVNNYISGKSNMRLIRHNKNQGKGAAVKTGIRHATYDTYLIQDADLELTPLDIPDMLIAMYELQVEFINGSRYLPGKLRPLFSFKRYWFNRIFTNLVSILIDVKLTDLACGYKLFKKSLYEKIELKEDRFGLEAELIIKAIRIKRNNIAEVPVCYFPRNVGEGKKLRNIDGLRILKTILLYGLLRVK